MAALLFGVKPDDPIVFCGVTLLLIGIALCAAFLPAWSASAVDPAIALRAE